MSAEQTPDIERVLAEHWGYRLINGYYTCACLRVLGEVRVTPVHEVDPRHRAHVAQALAPVLAAAVREARAAELREAAEAFGHMWQADPIPSASIVYRALRDRADRITEPVSHEAATSGEEASKA